MSRKREYYLSLAAIFFVITLAFFSMIGTLYIPKYSMPLTYLVQNLAIILIILITRKTIKYGYLQSDQTWPAAGLGILFISVVAAATVESLEIRDHWVMILNQLMLLFWAPIASSMVAGAIMNVIPLVHPTRNPPLTSDSTSPSSGDTTTDAGA